jgi:hypothetical protein
MDPLSFVKSVTALASAHEIISYRTPSKRMIRFRNAVSAYTMIFVCTRNSVERKKSDNSRDTSDQPGDFTWVALIILGAVVRMDPAFSVLCHLHPLLAIIQSAYDEYQNIRHNQEKCHHLIQRAEKVLITIDNEIVKVGRPNDLADAINRLEGWATSTKICVLIAN